jgi:hypothetical protein
VVLHDGAPNVGQNWAKDAFTQSELTLCSLKLATEFLKPHGLFITKVFRSADYNSLLWVFHQLFEKVEATKPHSSRNSSAEIFVACRDFKAPARIDPKLLDPRYVFKELEDTAGTGMGVAGGGGGNTLPIFHSKAALHNKRHREGYDEKLGPLLTRRLSVAQFVRAPDPIRVLTDASCFAFDAEADAIGYTKHEDTTDEVRACCDDLKIIGKADFKLLLKWRLSMRHAFPDALVVAKEPRVDGEYSEDDNDEEGEDAEEDGAEGGEEEEEEDSDAEELAQLGSMAAEELQRRKRERKRDKKLKAKAMRRQKLGLSMTAVDMLDTDHQLFNLGAIQKMAAKANKGASAADVLDAVREVNLDEEDRERAENEDEDEESEADSDIDMGSHKGADSEAADSDEDFEEDEEAALGNMALGGAGSLADRLKDVSKRSRLEELETQMDRSYAMALAKRQKREGEAQEAALAAGKDGKVSKGIKMTRRQKLAQQALLTEAALNGHLDAEHQRYLQLLSGARAKEEKRMRTEGGGAFDEDQARIVDEGDGIARNRNFYGDEGRGDDDEDSSSSSEGEDAEDSDEQDAAPRAPAGSSSGKASRWFSQSLFSDAIADQQMESLRAGRGSANADGDAAMYDPNASSDEEAPTKGKKALISKKGAAKDGEESEDSYEGAPNWMEGLPKSERDKWKERLKKKREREERRKERLAVKEAEMMGMDKKSARLKGKVGKLPGGFEVVQGDINNDDADVEFDRAVNAMADKHAASAKGMKEAAALAGKKRKRAAEVDAEDGEDAAAVDAPAQAADAFAGLSEKERKRLQAKRDLIRKGMGRALDEEEMEEDEDDALHAQQAADEDGEMEGPSVREKAAAQSNADRMNRKDRRRLSTSAGFDVVPATEYNSDDESSDDDDDGESTDYDPRLENYDSDTHAEMLALGKMMRKHTTAKALVDASYNRYAFDDTNLPAWFAVDEERHFKPQLPISREDVEGIRARFRDIAARPVAKVAEARSRKKMKAMVKAQKAKKQAENVIESEELQGRSKARALKKLYRGLEVKKPASVYVVQSGNGEQRGSTKGARKSGAKVKVVDPRMKKDKRGMKRAAKRNGGRR